MRLSGLAVIQEEDLMMMIHLLLTCCLDGSDDSDESDLFLCILNEVVQKHLSS